MVEGEVGAKIYQFPTKIQNCEDCTAALFGRSGIYCREYHEDIVDPAIATVCDAFDPEY